MTKDRIEEIRNNIELKMMMEQATGYRNEYSNPLTEEIDLYNEVIELQERIVYLERSNERKEETIIDYQTNEYSILEELKKWLEEQWEQSQDIWFVKIINRIKELEEGVK